jgi:hypothetical protein
MIVIEIIYCILLIIAMLNIRKLYSGYSIFDKSTLDKLCVYHLIIGVCFYFYININGGDAQAYWAKAQNLDFQEVLQLLSSRGATGFIVLINFIPANIFGFSFFTGSLFYIILGYWGILLFYNIIKENIPDYRALSQHKIIGIPIFPTLLFLPNLHFWTSGLGKDTVLFFCIALFIYSTNQLKKRFLLILISVVIGLYIRPHIILFLFTAYGFATMFDNRIKTYQKVFIVAILTTIFFSMFSYVMSFVQLDNLDSASIELYSNKKAQTLSRLSGSGVDISNYPYPLKVFTFLFRPLFFDINNALAIISSFENLFLLIFALQFLFKKPYLAFKRSKRPIKALIVFFVIGSLTFSLILGNFGIILRQKVPFIFSMIVFGYATISHYYRKRKVNHSLKKFNIKNG